MSSFYSQQATAQKLSKNNMRRKSHRHLKASLDFESDHPGRVPMNNSHDSFRFIYSRCFQVTERGKTRLAER